MRIDELNEILGTSLRYLVVTSHDVIEADAILNDHVDCFKEWSWPAKFKFLEDNFIFSMAGGYTQETNPDLVARENYYATLHYLIMECQRAGIKSVCRNA